MFRVQQILVDDNGNNVLGRMFDKIQLIDEFVIVHKNGLKGLYSIEDYRNILEVEWDKIELSQGFVCAERDSKMAFFDYSGKKVLPCEWDRISIYPNGILVSRNQRQGFYSYKGEVLLECVWKRIEPYQKALIAYEGNGTRRMIFNYRDNEIID